MAGDGGVAAGRAEYDSVSRFDVSDVVWRKPYRYFGSECDGIVGKHKSLQCFVSTGVVTDRRYDERRGARREIVAFDDERFARMERIGAQLRGASAVLEESVGTFCRNLFEKVRKRSKAPVLAALAKQGELRAVVGEMIDLAVIELDGAHGLRRCKAPDAFWPQASVARDVSVLGKPFRNR